MLTTLITYGIIAASNVQSPMWGNKDFQETYLTLTHQYELAEEQSLFVDFTNSARTQMRNADKWNPLTTLWKVEGGYTYSVVSISVGHVSEHEVNVKDTRTESYNFVHMNITLEL